MGTGRRRKRDADEAGVPRRGLLERLAFSFMGPPQLGRDEAPEGYVPDPQAELCHRCGQRWDDHERVRTSSMTYTTCPAPRT